MRGTAFCWPWATTPCSQQAVAGAGTAALLSKGSLSSPQARADTGASTPHTVMPVVAASPGYPLPLPRAAVHAGAAAPCDSRGLSMWAAAGPAGLLPWAPLLCPTPSPGLRWRLPLLPWSPYALQPVNILHCHHPSALCC